MLIFMTIIMMMFDDNDGNDDDDYDLVGYKSLISPFLTYISIVTYWHVIYITFVYYHH